MVAVPVEWPLLGETRLPGWTDRPALAPRASCPAHRPTYTYAGSVIRLETLDLAIFTSAIAHSERILTIPNSFLSILNFDSSIGWASFICAFFPPLWEISTWCFNPSSPVLDDPFQLRQHVFTHPSPARRSICLPGPRPLADPERPGRARIASLCRIPGYDGTPLSS